MMEICYLESPVFQVKIEPEADEFIKDLVDDLFKEKREREKILIEEGYKATLKLEPNHNKVRDLKEMEKFPCLEITIPTGFENCRSRKYGVVALGRKYYGKKIWLIKWLYVVKDNEGNFIVKKRKNNMRKNIFIED